MPAYPREELEEMVELWLTRNREVEETGDWRPLAELFTEDATYGWNYGPKTHFMVVGREEIREVALGLEMGGLSGWQYPYDTIVIDEKQGHVVGFWRQVADATREDGTAYEVPGIGGSWFRYGGNQQWSWQRDWFDYGNVVSVFLEMLKDGTLPDGLKARMDLAATGEPQPGHHPIAESPVGLWEAPE